MPLSDLCFVDGSGLRIPDLAEVLSYYKAGYRGIYGPDVYLEADSQDGQWVAFEALAAFDAFQLLADIYNSFSPLTALGDALSRNVRLNGIRRLTPTNSTADVVVVGATGTSIRGGLIQGTDSSQWALPAIVNIPLSGEIIVTATAVDAGAVSAAAGSLTKIVTPTRGWTSVTNPLASVDGRPTETDAELRRRQAISTMFPSLSVMEGIVAAVAAVNRVTRLRGYENDTNITDDDGVPGHTIAIVAEGGDDELIAQAIHRKKTAGTGTYAPDAAHGGVLPGGTTVTVNDQNGVPTDISFIRPTVVPIQVNVSITVLADYVDAEAEIQNAVAGYINNLAIGEEVYLSRLYTPANLGNVGKGATYWVDSIEIARDEDVPAAANLTLAFNEVASCNPETNILVQIV